MDALITHTKEGLGKAFDGKCTKTNLSYEYVPGANIHRQRVKLITSKTCNL